MRRLISGIVVVATLLLVNVVAAGAFYLLWPLVLRLEWLDELLGAALIGLVAVAAAVLVLLGAMAAPGWLRRLKSLKPL